MRRLWHRYGGRLDTALLIVGVCFALYAAVQATRANENSRQALHALQAQADQAAAQADRAADEALRTHLAICAFRSDLVERVQGTEEFLVTHPAGFAGIPRAQIEANLLNQRRTIRALRVAHCQ